MMKGDLRQENDEIGCETRRGDDGTGSRKLTAAEPVGAEEEERAVVNRKGAFI